MAFVEISGIAKQFGTFQALARVSLAVADRAVVSVVGGGGGG